jgi:hypothetical protein
MFRCLTCGKEFELYADDHPFYHWVIHRECGNWASKIGSMIDTKPGEPIVDIIQATRAYVNRLEMEK